MIVQPIACVDLHLPKSERRSSDLISEDFEQLTKKIQSTDVYGFGPKANIIAHLKGEWTKVFQDLFLYPTDIFIHAYLLKNSTSHQHKPNSKTKVNQSTKKPKNNPPQIVKTVTYCSLAHPALGMYSIK